MKRRNEVCAYMVVSFFAFFAFLENSLCVYVCPHNPVCTDNRDHSRVDFVCVGGTLINCT